MNISKSWNVTFEWAGVKAANDSQVPKQVLIVPVIVGRLRRLSFKRPHGFQRIRASAR